MPKSRWKAIVSGYTLLAIIMTVMLFSSCDDNPNGSAIPTCIHTSLELKTQTSLTNAIYTPTKGLPATWFVVNIYKGNESGTPVYSTQVGVEKDTSSIATLHLDDLSLQPGRYNVVAWAMAWDKTDSTYTGFNFTDLSNVTFSPSYYGNSNAKECYEARFNIDVPDTLTSDTVKFNETMHTPMAAVQIVTTDADAFLQSQSPSTATRAQLSDYSIKWQYDLYCPTGYNVLQGVPNKSETGIGFSSPLTAISPQEASLGFDYIFVNGEKSNVTLSLYVIDNKTRKVVNQYMGITVPLERGKATIIKDNFLTNKKDSGAGINPDFNGNIDITIPD